MTGLETRFERIELPLAAGCHIAPMVEYADLDGSLLLATDPFAGVPMPEGGSTSARSTVPGPERAVSEYTGHHRIRISGSVGDCNVG